MSHLHEGARIDAKTGQRPFIDEHADWGKCLGNLASIGLPDAVRETIWDDHYRCAVCMKKRPTRKQAEEDWDF